MLMRTVVVELCGWIKGRDLQDSLNTDKKHASGSASLVVKTHVIYLASRE